MDPNKIQHLAEFCCIIRKKPMTNGGLIAQQILLYFNLLLTDSLGVRQFSLILLDFMNVILNIIPGL